jgi:hypothetical protein
MSSDWYGFIAGEIADAGPQSRWRVSVTVPWTGDPRGATTAELDAARLAVAATAGADPDVLRASARYSTIPGTHDTPGCCALAAELTVAAPGIAEAFGRSWTIVRDSLRRQDGWDLAGPHAAVRPA